MAKSRVALPTSDTTTVAFIRETKASCGRCSCDCNAVEAFKEGDEE